MTRRAVGVAAALVVFAAAAVAAALLLTRGAGADASTVRPLRARAVFSDRIVLFGDTVRLRVELAVDRRRVEPDAIAVRARFAPWERVGPATTERSDAGSSSLVRITYVLRCLEQACVPEQSTLPFELQPARVEFRNRAGGTGSLRLPLGTLVVHSRVQRSDLTRTFPWRLDAASVPAPSYRARPGLVLGLLGGGALILAVAAIALAAAGWPRRVPEPVVEAEPEPEPGLTPLELALELLEDAERADGAADQRRSLELVAEVLGERGEEDELARAARALAWSPGTPSPAATLRLAADVRAALDEELRLLAEEREREEAVRQAEEAVRAAR